MLKFFQTIFFYLLIFYSSYSIAADVRFNVGSSIIHYDNVNLEVTPDSDEVSTSLNGGIKLSEDNASFTSRLDAQLRVINYHNNIVNDESNANIISNNLWRIKPNQFEWYIADTFTQTAIDSLGNDSPTNRQNVNVFSTGPNYIIRINSTNNLRFEARAENFSYEEGTDSNRLFIAARWGYDLNSAINITVNDEATTTKFTDDTVSDYNRNDVYIGVNYLRGLNTLNAEYGYTRINNEQTEDFSGGRYALSFTNVRTNTSSVRFIYENILTDNGTRILKSTDETLDEFGDNTSVNNIFVEQVYKARYMKALSNGELALELGVTNKDYELQSNLNQKDKVARFNGAWNLKRTNKIIYSIRYVDRIYQDPLFNRIDEDYEYSVGYLHEFMRNINLNIQAISKERISTIESEEYQDLRFILSINYSTL